MPQLYKDIAFALQFVVLRVIYDNFSTLVHAAHREIIRNGIDVRVIGFPKPLGGMSVVVRRDIKAHYYVDFLNIPFPDGPQDFTIKLGTGKNLVNRRVMNDVGVKLNTFLSDTAFSRKKSILMKYGLNFASSEVVIKKISWFSRLFGTTQINYDDVMDKIKLPCLRLSHVTEWHRLKHKTSFTIEVSLMGGVKETIYSI